MKLYACVKIVCGRDSDKESAKRTETTKKKKKKKKRKECEKLHLVRFATQFNV